MAATKIADIIVPAVFNPYVSEAIVRLSRLFASGLITNVQELSVLGMKGGTTVVMPFWKELDGAEEVLSDSTPLGVDKILSGQDIAVLNARGKAWGVNDLAKALSGSDPMAEIGNQVGAYWAYRMQLLILSMLKGVFAAATMAGNVRDISAETGDAAVISADAIVDAAYLLGDQANKITAIATHSSVVATMVKQNLIDTERDSDGTIIVQRYLGKPIIEDDSMPAAGGVYTTYMFGQGAFGYADGEAPVPTETDRDSLQGEDILINRRHFVLHPRGVKWKGAPAGVSPTNAEFEVGTNWERVYNPKNVRMVALKHRIVAVP